METAAFVYVDRDTMVTGVDEYYWELTLKKGWNLVQIDYDRRTVKNFAADENYHYS